MISRFKNNKWMRLALFGILGGLSGFLYYYYIGCYSGSCPITGNPYISSSYGMMIGVLLAFDSKKKAKND